MASRATKKKKLYSAIFALIVACGAWFGFNTPPSVINLVDIIIEDSLIDLDMTQPPLRLPLD